MSDAFPEMGEFRAEVRAFLADAVPDDIREKVAAGFPLNREEMVRWQRILLERRWAAQGWPKEVGGSGWSAAQRYVYDQETVAADAPVLSPFGLYRLAPVIYTFGTEEQKQRLLPSILDGSKWWCQGYSEPGAGSDLAAISTRAVREGENYIVNGVKTWTSMAHYSDAIFCLVRTSKEERPQNGLSFLLIDLDSSGVAVRPIPTLDGRANVNEVHFTDVRVPVDNRIGEEGNAWTYSRFLLGFERLQIAEVPQSQRLWRRACRLAADPNRGGLIARADVRRRLVECAADLRALELTTLRFLAAADVGNPPGDEASLLKLRGSQIRQALSELIVDLIGEPALDYDPQDIDPLSADVGHFLYGRASSIYGGSNEIQRTIIAKRILGL